MKEDYIDRLLDEAGRQGALRRDVARRCVELDARLAAGSDTARRRYYRLAATTLAVLLVATAGVNAALAAHRPQTLVCNNECSMQQVLTQADGVIASCRQNTMI